MTEVNDVVYAAFLEQQHREGLTLSSASDLVEVDPLGADLPTKYLVRFRCRGLVRSGGTIEVADQFDVGVRFPSDYLRRVQPCEVLTWLGPSTIYHPNISDLLPYICVGRLLPGTTLVDIIYQVFEVITYQKVTMREDDALNREACAWARRNQDRFPVDRRPLRRRTPTGLTPDAAVSERRRGS